MSKDSIPQFEDLKDVEGVDEAAKAAASGSTPNREDSINNLGDPDADGDFQERTDKGTASEEKN